MSDCKYNFEKYRHNHVVIEASAGTGKTYTIENMIPQFIEGGVSIDKIAILTFTEKAAAELQDRIRRALFRQIDDPNLTQESKKNIEETIDILPNANIGTIHHFCRSLIKKHSLKLGLSAKFSEIKKTNEELEIYFKKFWGRIEKDDPEDLIELLQILEFSRFRKILIQLTEKSGGKKIKLLEEENASSSEIDFFKLKSILDNIDLSLDKPAYITKLRNFREQKFTHTLDKLSGIKNTFLTGSSEPNQNIKKFITTSNSISEEEYNSLLKRLVLQMEKETSVQILNPIFKYANLLIEEYEKFLILEDKISLDGLILKARELINDKTLKKQIQKDIQYVILDECQDTNPIQIDLVTSLVEGLNKGIIFVGDPKQSIYRFRNADLISYSTAVNSLTNKEELRLDTSFRSSKKLMDVFNFIFPRFSSLPSYQSVKANRTLDDIAEKTSPPLLLLGLDQNNAPKTKDDLDNSFNANSLRKSTIDDIANLIQVITNNKEYLIEDKNLKGTSYREIKYSDIAILSNSNSSLNNLLREFSKKSISANIYKSQTFYSHKIVQAISHLLHVVENPNDSSSLYKALVSDLFLIPESLLYQLSQAGELSYLTDSSIPEINIIYKSLLKAHQNRYLKDIAYTLQEILKENRILEVISLGFDGKRNLANIYHLSEILNNTQMSENLSFGEVVRKLKKDVENSVEQEIRLDNDKKDDSFNSVQLMTIHASKGLEFPVCILFDLAASPKADDTNLFIKDSFLREEYLNIELKVKISSSAEVKTNGFQDEYNKNSEELLKEKERLLYVGFTRAKDYLVLPLLSFEKVNKTSLRGVIYEVFQPENISFLIKEKLAVNFTTKPISKLNTIESEITQIVPETFEKIKITSITKSDLIAKAGIKIQSYSSIAKYKESEEESAKERIVIEKTARSENDDTSPITVSSEKRGTTFGLLCHKVMENFNLKLLNDEQKVEKEVIQLVNEYYPKTGLNEIAEYTSKDAISFCVATLNKSYVMNEAKTEFAKIKDWKYLTREKSFFYKLKSKKMDYLIGIGDGMFYWNEKYYIVDWKTNLIKIPEGQTVNEVLEQKVKESYHYQYMIYSMNLIDSITQNESDKKEVWEKKFGGMLFIFMRIKEDNQGSLLIKPTYEEIVNFKSNLEVLQ